MARPTTRGSRPEAKRKPRDERHAELLDTAITIFHEKGYNASSLQDIADGLGILKGSLYYYIQSKEDLLFEVIASVHSEGLAVVTAAAATEGDPLDRLENVIVAHVLHTCRNLAKTAVVLHELDALPEEKRRAIVGREHAYQDVFRDLVTLGQRENLIRAELDPKIATLSVLGSLNWVYRWFRPGGPLSASKVARQLASTNLAALATAPALAARADPAVVDKH